MSVKRLLSVQGNEVTNVIDIFAFNVSFERLIHHNLSNASSCMKLCSISTNPPTAALQNHHRGGSGMGRDVEPSHERRRNHASMPGAGKKA